MSRVAHHSAMDEENSSVVSTTDEESPTSYRSRDRSVSTDGEISSVVSVEEIPSPYKSRSKHHVVGNTPPPLYGSEDSENYEIESPIETSANPPSRTNGLLIDCRELVNCRRSCNCDCLSNRDLDAIVYNYDGYTMIVLVLLVVIGGLLIMPYAKEYLDDTCSCINWLRAETRYHYWMRDVPECVADPTNVCCLPPDLPSGYYPSCSRSMLSDYRKSGHFETGVLFVYTVYWLFFIEFVIHLIFSCIRICCEEKWYFKIVPWTKSVVYSILFVISWIAPYDNLRMKYITVCVLLGCNGVLVVLYLPLTYIRYNGAVE